MAHKASMSLPAQPERVGIRLWGMKAAISQSSALLCFDYTTARCPQDLCFPANYPAPPPSVFATGTPGGWRTAASCRGASLGCSLLLTSWCWCSLPGSSSHPAVNDFFAKQSWCLQRRHILTVNLKKEVQLWRGRQQLTRLASTFLPKWLAEKRNSWEAAQD